MIKSSELLTVARDQHLESSYSIDVMKSPFVCIAIRLAYNNRFPELADALCNEVQENINNYISNNIHLFDVGIKSIETPNIHVMLSYLLQKSVYSPYQVRVQLLDRLIAKHIKKND